jgi:hypothetical protein
MGMAECGISKMMSCELIKSRERTEVENCKKHMCIGAPMACLQPLAAPTRDTMRNAPGEESREEERRGERDP